MPTVTVGIFVSTTTKIQSPRRRLRRPRGQYTGQEAPADAPPKLRPCRKCRRSTSAYEGTVVSPHRTKGYRVSREERKDYRSEGALMLLLAYGLIQSGIAALVNPSGADSTSVAQLLPSNVAFLERGWQVTYVIGGLLIFLGVLRPWPIGEVLGEWLSAWAMFINVFALLLVRGPAGAGASLGAFLIAIGICWLRIGRLHRRAHDRRNSHETFPGPEKRRRR